MKYSPQEERMFSLLTKQPQDTAQLRGKFYGREPPFHARSAIIAILHNLTKKIEANREPFKVKQTPRAGPQPSSFWIEEKR